MATDKITYKYKHARITFSHALISHYLPLPDGMYICKIHTISDADETVQQAELISKWEPLQYPLVKKTVLS